jgi:hypothetical protein
VTGLAGLQVASGLAGVFTGPHVGLG